MIRHKSVFCIILLIVAVFYSTCRNLKYYSDFRTGPVYVTEKNNNGIGLRKVLRKNKQSKTFTSDGILVPGFDLSIFGDTLATRPFNFKDIDQIKEKLKLWYNPQNNYFIHVSYYIKIKNHPRIIYIIDSFCDNWRKSGTRFLLLKFDNEIIINSFSAEEMQGIACQQIRSDIINRLHHESYSEKDIDYIMTDFDKGPQGWTRSFGRHID